LLLARIFSGVPSGSSSADRVGRLTKEKSKV